MPADPGIDTLAACLQNSLQSWIFPSAPELHQAALHATSGDLSQVGVAGVIEGAMDCLALCLLEHACMHFCVQVELVALQGRWREALSGLHDALQCQLMPYYYLCTRAIRVMLGYGR